MATDPNYAFLCDLPEGGAVGRLIKQWQVTENKSRAVLANRINSAGMLKGIDAMPEAGEPARIRGHLLMNSNIARMIQTFKFETPDEEAKAKELLQEAMSADRLAWAEQLKNVARSTENPMELVHAVMLQQAYRNPADKNFQSLSNMLNHFFMVQGITGPPGAYLQRSKHALKGGVAGEELCAPLLSLIDDEEARENVRRTLTQPRAVGHAAGLEDTPRGNTGRGSPG